MFSLARAARHRRHPRDGCRLAARRGSLQPAYAHLAVAPAGTAPVNLAPHAPAQAQYTDGSTAALQPGSQISYATGGDAATFAQATNQYCWQLVLDLQSAKSLGLVTVTMPQRAWRAGSQVTWASTRMAVWPLPIHA